MTNCVCGCGSQVKKGNKFINGHNSRIRKFSEETKEKMSESQKGKHIGPLNCMYGRVGERNPFYGHIKENITIKKLHSYVRKYNPPPEQCQLCHETKPLDLANITGVYDREFKNYAYLCRKCHNHFDNLVVRSWIKRKAKKKESIVIPQLSATHVLTG